MTNDPVDDPLLEFAEELDAPTSNERGPVWKVLIVDDEPDVHDATFLALNGLTVEGRRLEFFHAFSAAEAKSRLAEVDNLAVVLLDVVMESDDAGLQLVRYIRDDLKNAALRIILRTGQPGYAPEIDTINLYQINDYKTKSELTRIRLFTSVTVAIRSFWQIHQLDANRQGLELIIQSSTELSKPRGLLFFARGIVTQLCALLGVAEEGLVCAAVSRNGETETKIIAAAGRYADWIGNPLASISDSRVRIELESAISERHHRFSESTCLYFHTTDDHTLAAFIDVSRPLTAVEHKLLEVFCSNIAVSFENSWLYKKIHDLAFEDGLLEIPNRNSFLSSIDQREDTEDTLALVDLDGFADINSILDQSFGDAVLIAVVIRMRTQFGKQVTIARVGNDIFGLLGPAEQISNESITNIFSEPFEIRKQSLRLSATASLVHLADQSAKSAELLNNASVTLKQAKNFCRGKVLSYELTYAIAARERMHLLTELRSAFSADRLFVVYQPFVNLKTRQLVGAEALLRWRTDDGKFVAPDSFIPIAEQSGLMVAIGNWVMRSALQFLGELTARGYTDFRMAINVSHVQFREPDFVEKLTQAISHFQINSASVEIELTESVAIDNFDLIKQKLEAIRSIGISVAIDDFGTGYSSLSIIRQLAVDRLKIDRTFVSGNGSNNDDYRIAGMVLQLAEQLQLAAIAEGVETESQRQKLLELGCFEGQGYLFSKPLTASEFESAIIRDGLVSGHNA